MNSICLVCKNLNKSINFKINNANFSPNIKTMNIVKCENCNLNYLWPLPSNEEISSIYKKHHSFTEESTKRIFNIKKRQPFLKLFLERIYSKLDHHNFIASECKKHFPKNIQQNLKALDVGCNIGLLMRKLKLTFPLAEINGIDIDPNSKQKAVPESRESIIIGDFLDYESDQKYDLILLNMVIEHLVNPKEYLIKANSLLKEDGLLFIGTPDINSSKALILGPKGWDLIQRSWQYIGHIIWFNQKSLDWITNNSGFTKISTHSMGEWIYHVPKIIRILLFKLLGKTSDRNRFIKNYYLRMINAIADCIGSRIFSYGDLIFAFYKKKI